MDRKKIVGLCVVGLVCSLAFNGQLFGANATGDGTEQIHACKVLSMSILRMVDDPGDCTPVIEESVSWRVGPEHGTEFPAMCQACNLSGASWFAGRNLSNSYFYNNDLSSTDFTSTDFTNSILKFSYFNSSDFTSTTFINAKLNYAILTNTDMTEADFANADLSNADLTGATGLATSSLSGLNGSKHTVQMVHLAMIMEIPVSTTSLRKKKLRHGGAFLFLKFIRK